MDDATDTMDVDTTRFGVLRVEAADLIELPRGLIGFESATRFVMLDIADEDGADAAPTFWWLQSLDRPELAVVVTDPGLFLPDYRVDIHPAQMLALGLMRAEDAQPLVIVNRHGGCLTANLQGPIVVNPINRTGAQLILSQKNATTRAPLMPLPEECAAPAPRPVIKQRQPQVALAS